ncbi:MAG: hypothetical protein AAF790_08085 [Planctomycetota bacterium]
MSESDFFQQLRQCILAAPDFASGYCDWGEPRRFRLGGQNAEIHGKVGFVNGGDAWSQKFVLYLGKQPASRDEIEWASLLSQDDSTGQFFFDNDVLHIHLRDARS